MTPATRRRLLCAAVAAGYGLLLVETLMEHHAIFVMRWQSFLPPLTAGLGLPALALAAATWRSGARRAAVAVSVASLVVGLAGFWFHNADRLANGFSLDFLVPPPLAPLAFAGQGVLALLLLWGDGDARPAGDGAV
jgi:hypothetical protein